MGGPQVIGEVEASVDGVVVFSAGKAYAYSPAKDTLLTYFFEVGNNVMIFELNRRGLAQGKLIWNEILRKGRLFRAVMTIPKDDEWTSDIFHQDEKGMYQIYAKNVLRRKWKEAYRKKG